MARKIHKLEENGGRDYTLFVIASAENDYRISWLLNNALSLSLTRTEDLKIYHQRLDGDQQFAHYECHDEDRLLHYRLLSNRSESGILLEEMSNIDFVLQINGELSAAEAADLLARINALSEIILVYQVDPATLRSGHKLHI